MKIGDLHPNWYMDRRPWPERMKLAMILGDFLPGDRIAADTIMTERAGRDDWYAGYTFATAVQLGDVPHAVGLYPKCFPDAEAL